MRSMKYTAGSYMAKSSQVCRYFVVIVRDEGWFEKHQYGSLICKSVKVNSYCIFVYSYA